MALAWPGSSLTTAWRLSRGTAPIARSGSARASPIPWTRSRRRGQPSRGGPPGGARPETGRGGRRGPPPGGKDRAGTRPPAPRGDAGDNPERSKWEAAFVQMCAVRPLEAAAGKVTRHRLNRGGNRQANHALFRVVVTRMGSDPRTIRYVERRRKEGKSTPEIMRVLKRYVARETFKYLPRHHVA